MNRVIVLVVMLLAVPAAAEPNVQSSHDDLDTIAALTKVRQQMAVCWQRKPPASVTIKLAVGKDGAVTKATAKTKGGAAQCAAGILAVSTLAPQAKAWKGTVVLKTDASGKAGDARLINETLVAAGDSLRRCQGKAPTFVGNVMLKVTFGSDGVLTDATAKADAGGDGVGTCVANAARKLTYPALSGAVAYELSIAFAGEAAAPETADDLTGGEQPQKKGPLDGDAALDVIRGKHDALRACAKKGKGKGVLKVRVAIGADGKVTKATVKTSELDDEAIESCAVAIFAKLKFPAADGETVIVYPIKY